MSARPTLRSRLFNLLRRQGDRARDGRDWARAAAAYRRALRVDSEAWAIWVQLGHALKEAGEPAQAREAYLKALKIRPATADTALHLGHLAKLAEDVDDARRWYARALVWPPGELDAALELAALGIEGAALEALIAETEPAYAPEPTPKPPAAIAAPGLPEPPAPSPAASEYWGRGDAARDAGDWIKAAMEYRRGLSVDETAWPMWVQMGHALKEAGDRYGALEAYRRALAIAPEVSDTALQIGHVTKLLGNLEDASRWYARALIWPPGELDAAIELSRMGIEGAALEALIAATEPHYFSTPDPAAESGPARIGWLLPETGEGEPDAVAAWLTAIGMAAPARAEPLAWDAATRRWGPLDGAEHEPGFSLLILTPGPAGLDRLQLAACRTLALRAGARIVLALPSPGALFDGPMRERLADLVAIASVVVVFTSEDEGVLRGRMAEIALGTPLIRLQPEVRPARGGRAPKGEAHDLDILLAGAETSETERAVAAHARLGKGRVLHVQAAGEALSDVAMRALLARARTLVAPAAFPGLEVWLSRACEAGVPVMASVRGPAYRLFGHALADYIDLGEARDLPERWAGLGALAAAGEPDAPRWAEAILDAVTAAQAEVWPSPLRRPPFVAFGDFRALDGVSDGHLHGLGEGWAGFGANGALLDGPATLRLRLAPHRSAVRFMVLYGSGSPGARLRVTARAGTLKAQTSANLGKRRWGWAQVALTPPVGPNAEVILDLAPAGTLTIAGFAVWPEREDRYWYELLDRAARGEAPDLWRATRRLASPVEL